MTAHGKMYTNSFPFLNGIPFTTRSSPIQKKIASMRMACVIRAEKKWHPFERLVLSVQKKTAAIRTACVICSEKSAAVRTACVICSEKICSRLNSLGHPFRKKLASVRTACVTRQGFLIMVSPVVNSGHADQFSKLFVWHK